jgi:quinol monooxygenase YgiN
MPPIHVITLAESRPEHLALVRQKLIELADMTRMAEGCLRCDVYADADHPERFNTIELWVSETAHQAHLDSPHLFKTVTSLIGKMQGMPQVRVLDIVSELES